MKMMKSLMLMMVGGASVLAYQKYKEPLMNKMNAMLDQKHANNLSYNINSSICGVISLLLIYKSFKNKCSFTYCLKYSTATFVAEFKQIM